MSQGARTIGQFCTLPPVDIEDPDTDQIESLFVSRDSVGPFRGL
jgi:hypothetical protein